MAKRYEQMFPLIAKVKPRTIVEIGVHTALRGVKLCREALVHRDVVHYIGCDIFSQGDEKFQEAALNGKGLPNEALARDRMRNLPRNRFTYDFIVGDTRDTLKGAKFDADFAFVDGDHRVDAIRSDYASVSNVGCVVFDDYYLPCENGKTPNLSKYGANQVVDELKASHKVEILPIGDACKHGGISHLAVVWK